jgi:hypothetical protein
MPPDQHRDNFTFTFMDICVYVETVPLLQLNDHPWCVEGFITGAKMKFLSDEKLQKNIDMTLI